MHDDPADHRNQADATTGGPVIVITGKGHARRDSGGPVVLRVAVADLSVLSIGQLDADPASPAPHDHRIVTAPHRRDDPCAAFQ